MTAKQPAADKIVRSPVETRRTQSETDYTIAVDVDVVVSKAEAESAEIPAEVETNATEKQDNKVIKNKSVKRRGIKLKKDI